VTAQPADEVAIFTRSDVTSVHYTQSQKLRQKLAALLAWERRVKQIVGA
jgi:hypothetical protein